MPVSFCATATDAANVIKTQESSAPAEHIADIETIESKKDDEATSLPDTNRNSSHSLLLARVAGDSAGDKPEGQQRRIIKTSKNPNLQPCEEGRVHPLHIVRLERVCASCAAERDERLRSLDSTATEIRIEPRRWQQKRPGKIITLPQKEKRNRSSGVSVGGIANVLGARTDSGVWTASAKWMRDWKGGG